MRMPFRLSTLIWILLLALLVAQWSAYAQELKPWRGGPAPALALSTADGSIVNLADLRGKVVLVNFWATWCEPCRDEMPSLARLQSQMAGMPFAVLTVNMGESEPKVAAFLDQFKLDLKVLFDRDSGATKRWKVGLLPATFVIGPDGRIRYSLLGEAAWDSPGYVAAIRGLLAPPVRKEAT